MNNEELIRKDKQINELQKTIDDLNQKLNDSESLKSNFISNIMNEVYNPFSSIISMADNIQSLNSHTLSQAKSMARIIYREAAQLDFHLQNIFTAASIEAGLEDLSISQVNINEVLENVLTRFRTDIDNKNLKIDTNLANNNDIVFATDSKKITLILLNLLSNSIKYSPDGSTINLDFEVIEGYLNISVNDQGEGMAEEDIKNLFNRFSRINTTINSVTGGAGLGLSVVKALLEILNANIKIVSDKGTKIFLAIPPTEIADDDMMVDEEIF